jgi:outer membrane biogenesis lipoprotein LolB
MHHRHSAQRTLRAALCTFAALFLTACAHDGYYQPTENSASQKSGVTVFGEIDTSVVHTR